MEKAEFLQKLSETPRQWQLLGGKERGSLRPYIRLCKGEKEMCPLTSLTGEGSNRWKEAARNLGIADDLRYQITNAADGTIGPEFLAMRREILAACGLPDDTQ